MPEPKPDLIAKMDQATAEIAQAARLIAAYHHALLECGLPVDSVDTLTRDYQQQFFEQLYEQAYPQHED